MTTKQIIKAKKLVRASVCRGEWFCFGDVLKRLGSPKFESARYDMLYRGWQELKADGSLSLGVSGLYRINQ